MRLIQCDHCGEYAPPLEEIKEDPAGKTGGLNAMGWHCAGGSYACPVCKKEDGDARPAE